MHEAEYATGRTKPDLRIKADERRPRLMFVLGLAPQKIGGIEKFLRYFAAMDLLRRNSTITSLVLMWRSSHSTTRATSGWPAPESSGGCSGSISRGPSSMPSTG